MIFHLSCALTQHQAHLVSHGLFCFKEGSIHSRHIEDKEAFPNVNGGDTGFKEVHNMNNCGINNFRGFLVLLFIAKNVSSNLGNRMCSSYTAVFFQRWSWFPYICAIYPAR